MVEIIIKVSQEIADKLCCKSAADKEDLARLVQSLIHRALNSEK